MGNLLGIKTDIPINTDVNANAYVPVNTGVDANAYVPVNTDVDLLVKIFIGITLALTMTAVTLCCCVFKCCNKMICANNCCSKGGPSSERTGNVLSIGQQEEGLLGNKQCTKTSSKYCNQNSLFIASKTTVKQGDRDGRFPQLDRKRAALIGVTCILVVAILIMAVITIRLMSNPATTTSTQQLTTTSTQKPTTKRRLVAGCPASWSHFPATQACYKTFHDANSWENAETKCVNNGGHLTSIHSIEENNFVGALATGEHEADNDNKQTFIGLRDVMHNGQWSWSDGTTTKYSNWFPGEPNNLRKNEFCVQMFSDRYLNYPQSRYTWNNFPCDSPMRTFICKRPTTWS